MNISYRIFMIFYDLLFRNIRNSFLGRSFLLEKWFCDLKYNI